MKKLMTSTIIILPLLLLAILLVSGAIMSLVTHIHVESVEFSKKDAVVIVMDDKDKTNTYDLSNEVLVFPANANNRELTYKSMDEKVATVDDKGVVTPQFYGATRIIVTSKEDSAVSAERKIVVTGEKVYKLEMNDYPKQLNVGEHCELSVNIYPVDALNKAIKWKSEDENILKVNANGTVTAVGAGQVTITASSDENAEIKAYATINCLGQSEEGFNVYCSGKTLRSGTKYQTLLDDLTFEAKVKGSRPISYQIDDGTWHDVVNGKFTVENTSMHHTVSVRCDTKEISFELEKVALQDFDFNIFATLNSDSGAKKIDLVDNINSESDYDSVEMVLAKNVQDCITLNITLKDSILGGFGSDENFQKCFAYEGANTPEYDSLNNQIIISFAGLQNFDQNLSFKVENKDINLHIKRVYITDIEFTDQNESFDMEKSDDVHKGYQQVRVFAKHSFYNFGQEHKTVDYFKIPFNAFVDLTRQTSSSPDSITWDLSRYVGEEGTILTSQNGSQVIYNGERYKIVNEGEEYVLKSENNLEGEAVSGKEGLNKSGITWVDAYSEPGFARIYFGNFKGLSEVDVQNDYFGNFDERGNWTRPAQQVDDHSGRKYEISDSSFSFLKVEAGDGAIGGERKHFNFNVLDDDQLINVFDAQGYYQNQKIVLQTRLYGKDEKDGDSHSDLVLLDYNNLNKDTIYGNGNLINYESMHQYLKSIKEESSLGHSGGVTLGSAYNLKIYGANPNEEILPKNQSVVLIVKNLFYCDLRYYAKINPSGGVGYIKNTVLYGASRSAIQLYYDNTKVYMENIIFSESLTAISMENGKNETCYFKGFYDVLNYSNSSGIQKALPVASSLIPSVMKDADSYAEWLGKSNKDYDFNTRRFVNSVIFVTANFDSNKPLFWDEDQEKYVETGNINLALDIQLLGWRFATGWTYDNTVEVDGGRKDGEGNYTTRDMDQLFTEERDIRLLCQIKGFDSQNRIIKNDDHILWHIQKVYRDLSLISGRIEGHIENLIETLKGTTWEDGTGIDEEGNILDPMADLNELTSCAILPQNKKYI